MTCNLPNEFQPENQPAWPGYGKFLAIVREIYPHAFTKPPRPLAIGIDAALISAFPELPPTAIKAFLNLYTRKAAYLERIIEGAERVDLCGIPTSAVTLPQAMWSKARRKVAIAAFKAYQDQAKAEAGQ